MIPDMLEFGPLGAAYRAGTLTPVDLVRALVARLDAYDDLAVWITRVPEDRLLADAQRLAALPGGPARLPLYGLPFAVKDNIDVAGLDTTAACPAFAHRPERSASVVERLVEAGAILVGKTNLDQFATGLVGTRSPYGAPRSVFDRNYISGGSSSGSAVAVAAGLVAFALGTDTAGSGRVPAAFNNIVGLKPTRGLISTAGVVPACRSLDCVSILAASAGDAAAVLSVTAGFDPADPFSRPAEPVGLELDRFRVGVLRPADREFFGDAEAASLYDAAITATVGLGGRPVEIDFAPFRAAASLLYDGPWVAERLAAIGAFYRRHAAEMDPVVRAIIAGAEGRSAVEAFEGQYRLAGLAQAAAAQWRAIDLLLLPTTPTIYRVDEIASDPVGLNSRLGLYTNFVNLLDYAAIAVPAGFRPGNGLPFGVTLIGPRFADHDLAVLGHHLHRALGAGTGKSRRRPSAEEPAGSSRAEAIPIVVAGAHLSGLPLNPQLLALGGRLEGPATTDPGYRLVALPGTTPPKPGLVRTPGFAGPGIEVEVWLLPPVGFGRFVAALPRPMAIGKVALADGRLLPGFVCEPHALEGGTDVTAWRSWRRYVAGEPPPA